MKKLFPPLMLLVALAVGCDDFNTESNEGARGGGGALAESMTGMGIAQDMQAGGSYESKPAPAPEPAKPENETPKTENVKIEQGFTGKGQYGQGGGEKPMDIITVPVGQLFAVRERMFLMQLKHTEDLYKANNDNEMPKTHEEYMEKIIKEGMLKLPDLPPDQEYVYDPETQELKIKKPR